MLSRGETEPSKSNVPQRKRGCAAAARRSGQRCDFKALRECRATTDARRPARRGACGEGSNSNRVKIGASQTADQRGRSALTKGRRSGACGTSFQRHGRACPGHPRGAVAIVIRRWRRRPGVDGRDKPGHDEGGRNQPAMARAAWRPAHASAVLAVNVKPLRGRFANVDRSARRRLFGRHRSPKNMEATCRADRPQASKEP